MQITGYDPNLEVNGAYLLGVIGSLNEDDVRPFRERHNLTTIDPNRWYPVKQVVNFYEDIANAPGGTFNLVAVGMNVSLQMEYPPHVKTLDDVLAIAQQMHYNAWRGGHPGDLEIELIDAHHARFTFRNLPLPADLVYGLCFGMLKRFSPPGTHFKVACDIQEGVYIYDLSW